MAQLIIDLPDEVYEALKGTFLDDDKSIIAFIVNATEEHTAWLTSQGRPNSMSDIETRRIFSVYNKILVDRLPTFWEIGEYFNLPLGRSRYIVQNLSYRYPLFVEKRKKEVLIFALTNCQEKEGLHLVRCPKECSELLDTIISDVHLAHPLNAMPSKRFYTHDVIYEMGDEDRIRLINHIKLQGEEKNG